MLQIGIIGAGVNGVACASKILEHYRRNGIAVRVTIISEDFTPNTTGDGSAGLWGPYLLGGTSPAKIYQWSKSMHDFLEALWLSPDAGEAGVCLLPCVRVTTAASATIAADWTDIVYGCKKLTAEQLAAHNVGRKRPFTAGISFVTYTSEPIKLLPYLMKRFTAAGGRVVREKVTNLDEFVRTSPYQVIVNCTGLGSKALLRDEQAYAVRGQVSRVQANWLYSAILDESDRGNYIIPNMESVVLGGTHQQDDYNTNVCALDKDFIVEGCRVLVPGLAQAQHLYDWVGLRPGRTELRLEALQAGNKLLIHNYGHGGSGVTLSWGCADDVLALLVAALKDNNTPKQSKL